LIRIAIIADSPARARHLADLLGDEEGIEVLAASGMPAQGGQHAFLVDVLVAAGVAPDQLPDADVPVVVLSEQNEVSPIGPVVRASLSLNASAGEIVAAITAAASDLTVLTQTQVRRLFRSGEGPPPGRHGLVEALTSRELQVLRMLAEGLGNKEIAARLGISDHTAKFHVTQILGKLGAATRTEAVAIGIRRGLVPI
jgi:DNA-binding NarL/FixJ family response regulator